MFDLTKELQVLLATEAFKVLNTSDFIEFQQLTAAQILFPRY